MDSKAGSSHPLKTSQEDVDLGQLFDKTGGAINGFLSGLKRFFLLIGKGIMNFLFFIRRNLAWLLIGALAGVSYGYYIVAKYGAVFTADLTVQANFNSTRSLYGSVDYFNSLIGTHIEELARVLRITPAEAASLKSFEAEPVKSEIIISQIYQDQFINNQFGLRPRMDTFWIRTMSYKDFKSSLTKYDYPQQQISVSSTDPSIFPKLQQAMIDMISSNDVLQQAKTKSATTNKQAVELLSSSIRSLDTLTLAYSKRLSNTSGESKGNNVAIMDGIATPHFPELEVYDKILAVSEELRNAQNRDVLENNIIQVYSPFPSIGQKEHFFRRSVVKFGLFGLAAAFVILSAISLYKLLSRIEKERKVVSQ